MEKTLEQINKSAVKFLIPLNIEDTYKMIVQEAVRIIKADYGSILLMQDDGQLKRVYASKLFAYKTTNRKNANTYKCFKSRKSIIVPISELAEHHPEMQKYGIKWTTFIPLYYQSKSIGVMVINTKKEQGIDNKDLNALNLFGSFATLAILNAKSRDEVKRTLDSRDLFIALASHELKTPLTTISGYVQLLSKKITSSDDKLYKWITNLKSETNRLVELVKELLEIDQIKSGKLSFNWTTCDLNDLINQAVSNIKLIHPQRKIIYVNHLKNKPSSTIGDSNKLLQVILNVTLNALKYSDKDVDIKLDTMYNSYIIVISDKGIGIEKNDQEKIFNDFFRGGNNNSEGMGLGLFLTKLIVDSHKGKIEINSQLNKGTTISIVLPSHIEVDKNGSTARVISSPADRATSNTNI